MIEATVLIGHQDHEHVIIQVLGRMHPEATDRWDGNWLLSPVKVSVGGFSGVIPHASLRSDELRWLRRGLEDLYETLTGSASLESMEDWLSLTFKGDGSGTVEVTGSASEHRGTSTGSLQFTLEIDQTFLPPIIESLKSVETTYEVFETDP